MNVRTAARRAVAAVVAVLTLVGCSAHVGASSGTTSSTMVNITTPADAPALPGLWHEASPPSAPPPPAFPSFSSSTEWQRHLAIASGVVLEVDPYLRARGLDGVTGASRWSVDAAVTVGGNSYLAVFSAGDGFVVTTEVETVLLDASTGQRRWTGPGASGAASVDPVDGVVVILDGSRTVRALSLADGVERWHRSGIAKADGVVAASGSVAVSNAQELDVLDGATGNTTWTASVPAGVGPMAVSDGVVAVVGYIEHVAMGFDLAAGAPLWTLPLPAFMPCCSQQRRILAGAGRAVVVDGPGFMSVSLADGQGGWTQAEKDVTSATLVADRLVSTSDSGLLVHDATSDTVEARNPLLAIAEIAGDGVAVTVEIVSGAHPDPGATGQTQTTPLVLAGYRLP
ncbi:MAG: outer membrane protein assembly factor BamB family protein [Acidimicrobiales bacterium]